MKFSDIKKEMWSDLAPYLDTCLLPLTGLTGREAPHQVTEALTRLQAAMDTIEMPYKGRVVTYPSLHYFYPPGMFAAHVDELCARLKEGGFRYVIAVTADPAIAVMKFAGADLLVAADTSATGEPPVAKLVERLWQQP